MSQFFASGGQGIGVSPGPSPTTGPQTWAGQGVGPGDPACSQLRPERLLAGGLSGPGSLGAGRTEDQGCARGAGGQGF